MILSKKITSYVLAFFLVFILGQRPYVWSHPASEITKGQQDNFAAAFNEYYMGLCETAVERLEGILDAEEELAPVFAAKVYLLGGACLERLKKNDKAREYFSKLKELLDRKEIAAIPEITGIDPTIFETYRDVFAGTSLLSFDEPTPVSDIMEKNVVHAPRKSIEQKEKEKERKKIPWLWIVGGVVIVGTALVLLLTSKKGKPDEFPEVDWVRIPAGEFLMGDNFNEGDSDEQPVHKVNLDEYYISKYEIAIQQYFFFCDETGRKKPFNYDPKSIGIGNERLSYAPLYEPMYNISYTDAQDFCDWLSQKTGKNIHLPTEAQWEKAARGTEQYRYPWGNEAPDCTKAMYWDCLDTASYNGLVSVDKLEAGKSPFGIFHMAGNVREWCLDWYDPSYYLNSPEKNPQGPDSGSYRVIRGGGKHCYSPDLRSAGRDFEVPEKQSSSLGFRVVME